MSTPSPSGTFRQSSIVGTGSYVPERILTNTELEKIVETSDEWIISRTGISERRLAAADETTSDMAAAAASNAMHNAGVTPDEIDLIIVATVTSDMFFPSTACFVQKKIEAFNAVAFDISAACSGFLYAVQIARHFINTGNRKTALIIGAEKLSSLINWEDRNTCVLFGDGAGAVVLRGVDETAEAYFPGQILSTIMACDGRHTDILSVPGGGSATPITPENVNKRLNTIYMEGREVFKYAVTNMRSISEEALAQAGLSTANVDLIVAHQANKRIIDALAEKMGIPPEKVFLNVNKYGNTSAASIAIALDEANRTGILKPGMIVLMVAFGAGLTWAGTVVRW